MFFKSVLHCLTISFLLFLFSGNVLFASSQQHIDSYTQIQSDTETEDPPA